MLRSRLLLTTLWLALAGAALVQHAVLAQETVLAQEAARQPTDSWESAAKKLGQATLTVRILTARPADPAASDASQPPQSVTVCSGVCVRDGQIVLARSNLAEQEAKYKQVNSLYRSGGGVDSIASVINSPLISTLRGQQAELMRKSEQIDRSVMRSICVGCGGVSVKRGKNGAVAPVDVQKPLRNR